MTERPTRQEQAQAILHLRARTLASRTLGRTATNTADFAEAFNLERVDLLAEISDPATLLSLGRNVSGPRDGLYVIDDAGGYRVYIQEKGEVYGEIAGAGFDEARNAVIDRLIQLQGIPYRPPGA
jgi:hypothetical protein